MASCAANIVEIKDAGSSRVRPMRAYYFDDLPGDQRAAHDCVPSRPVDASALAKMNVLSWHIPVEGYESQVDAIARERGYKNRDTINVSKAGMGDVYEAKIRGFFEEHMHEDEEIRYILSGSGFFDKRLRTHGSASRSRPATCSSCPRGIYHRFTLDETDAIKALRLFQDEPKWVPHARSQATDVNVHRVGYLQAIGVGA
ncbi:1,2-dihydroxy-3-keto-5-methylthiopentene dioxygenase [Mycena chlorophos]|uniref:Acireductone dioxygenase n=1 Tax=Mycena chlorophos TaxID=658473 RepID=A0A8H6RXJ9_MYCCL|nr:1,2-dihydroxy-3-keto-5-methylthiopentene dioxygenase [Mycena chlorophos]